MSLLKLFWVMPLRLDNGRSRVFLKIASQLIVRSSVTTQIDGVYS